MNKQGKMRIINVQSDIMDIFNMTGFSDILTIEWYEDDTEITLEFSV